MRLWVDGKRKPPVTYDTWAKTAWEAIQLIQQNKVSAVSMDYDLVNKSDTGDGYILACWIEKQAVEKKLQKNAHDNFFFAIPCPPSRCVRVSVCACVS